MPFTTNAQITATEVATGVEIALTAYDEGTAEFRLYRRTGQSMAGAPIRNGELIATLQATDFPYIDTGATPGTHYYVVVQWGYVLQEYIPTGDEFIITINTAETGTSENNQFILSSAGTYDVIAERQDAEGSVTFDDVNGTETLTFPSEGIWKLFCIGKGVNPLYRIRFNNSGDRLKLYEINQWGTAEWGFSGVFYAFYGCSNMILRATDTPNLSSTTSLRSCFEGCTKLGSEGDAGSISNWDVSTITEFRAMFRSTPGFNQPIGDWDVSNATSFGTIVDGMFYTNYAFNQNIGNWSLNTEGVSLHGMFRNSGVTGYMTAENLTDSFVGWINNAVDNGNLPVRISGEKFAERHFSRSRGGGTHFASSSDAYDFASAPNLNAGALMSSDTYHGVHNGVRIANGGSGYVVNDILTVVQGANETGQLRVVSVDGSGTVTEVSIEVAGSGYILDDVTITGGTGSGFEGQLGLGWRFEFSGVW